jgi:hypothetical protein
MVHRVSLGPALAQQPESATRTITHITLDAARINTAPLASHTAQRTAQRRTFRVRSGFPVRRAVHWQGATGCARLQLPMHSGSRIVVRQLETPARDRTSPTWQFWRDENRKIELKIEKSNHKQGDPGRPQCRNLSLRMRLSLPAVPLGTQLLGAGG